MWQARQRSCWGQATADTGRLPYDSHDRVSHDQGNDVDTDVKSKWLQRVKGQCREPCESRGRPAPLVRRGEFATSWRLIWSFKTNGRSRQTEHSLCSIGALCCSCSWTARIVARGETTVTAGNRRNISTTATHASVCYHLPSESASTTGRHPRQQRRRRRLRRPAAPAGYPPPQRCQSRPSCRRSELRCRPARLRGQQGLQ